MWRIGEILIQKKLISWEQLENALEEQKHSKTFTGDILVQKGFISRHLLYKSLAEQQGMRFVDLKRTVINRKAVDAVPRSVAERFQIMPIELAEEGLTVGISNPLNVWPKDDLKKLTNVKDIQSVLCIPSDIQEAIEENYTGNTN